MKVLDKIALVLFSSIVLILSIVMCICIFGWLKLGVILVFLQSIINDPVSSNVTLGVLTVFILLAIKAIFFSSEDKDEDEELEKGILIQDDNGTLLISKDTIQNLVSGVVREFEGAKDITAKVSLSKENDINIEVVLFVEQEVIIKELSNNLQQKIKEVIKKSIDLDIKEVNIKVKNIAPKTQTED